jgi:N4-gp56 family major capsid protein
MANSYVSTDTASLGGTAGSAGLVQKAYDRLVEFALRTQPLIRSVADKRPSNLTNPGSTVNFQIYKDLARVSGNLSETVDPDAVAMSTPTNVPVTLKEYGNAVLVTRALNLFSLADVDPAVANIIAYNMADSIDELAQSALDGGTNVIYGGTQTSQGAVTGSDIITAANIRKAVAKLRAANAVARKGSMYWCGIHPEIAHDLRKETGAGAWRTPHEYQTNENIWAGEIGAFEGAYFIETPRLKSDNKGASTGSGSFNKTGTVASGALKTITVTVALTAAQIAAGIGNIVSGTGVTTGTRVTAISADGLTLTVDTDITAGSSVTFAIQPTAKVYRTFIAGQQALAEAVAEEPHVVIGPVVDKLMRHRPMGWYGVLGFSRFREEALYRLETGSSIA